MAQRVFGRWWSYGGFGDRIPAVTSALLAPPAALLSPVAGQVDQGGGWLYHLLTKLGVEPSTASAVTDLIIRPLSILVVLVVALIVARLGAKAIRRVLERVADQAAMRAGTKRAGARVATMSGLVANVWRLFVFVMAGAIVLGMLGINLTPLLASATIIGATLGFGLQQIVRDYFSGVIMTLEDQYNVGDSVTIDGVTGTIEEVTMRLTRFRGVDGTVYIVPNGDIRLIGNLSRGWARAVVDLTLPGRVAADLETVGRVVEEAAHRVATSAAFAAHCTEPPRLVGLQAADANTVMLRVMLHTVPSQRDALDPRPARGGGRGVGPGRPVAGGGRAGHALTGVRRLDGPPHRPDRRLGPGPQGDLRRRLVHQHAQPAEHHCAGRRRRRQPGRGARRVDQVHRHLARVEQARIDDPLAGLRRPRVPGHPHRRGIDDQVGRRHRPDRFAGRRQVDHGPGRPGQDASRRWPDRACGWPRPPGSPRRRRAPAPRRARRRRRR